MPAVPSPLPSATSTGGSPTGAPTIDLPRPSATRGVSVSCPTAAAVNRKTLQMYVRLPNYRNYWKEAGYVEEMEAVEKALDAGERARVPGPRPAPQRSRCSSSR